MSPKTGPETRRAERSETQKDAPVHISSLIVHVHPEAMSDVRTRIVSLGGEISAEDPAGKLVVVVETQDEAGVTGFADALRNLHGVILANLVFHSIDGPDDETAVDTADHQ